MTAIEQTEEASAGDKSKKVLHDIGYAIIANVALKAE